MQEITVIESSTRSKAQSIFLDSQQLRKKHCPSIVARIIIGLKTIKKFITTSEKRILLLILACFISGVCALVLPILPVHTPEENFSWPQQSTATKTHASVIAPLTLITPQSFIITIPAQVIDNCAQQAVTRHNNVDTPHNNDHLNTPSDKHSTISPAPWSLTHTSSIILSTIPISSPIAIKNGLLISTDGKRIVISSRGTIILSIPHTIFTHNPQHQLTISNVSHTIWASVADTGFDTQHYAASHNLRIGPELLPQIDGIFTDFSNSELSGSFAHIDIDNRFDISPTWIKTILWWLGILATLCSLIIGYGYSYSTKNNRNDMGNHRLLTFQTLRKAIVHLPKKLWQKSMPRTQARLLHLHLDLTIATAVIVWQFFGPISPGDGAVLSEVSNSMSAGYYGEYFRFFGVTKAPFDWYYHILSMLYSWQHSYYILLILPGIAGVLSWILLSRAVFPQWSGSYRTLPYFTAGMMFLGLWFCMDSGLRPEPIIALLTLLCLISIQVAIQQRLIYPLNYAILTAGLSMTCGATGIIAIAIPLAYLIPLSHLVISTLARTKKPQHYIQIFLPMLSTICFSWALVFRTQTIATVYESIRVKLNIGPVTSWTQEYLRYFYIFYSPTAIKLPIVLAMVISCGVYILSALNVRNHRAAITNPYVIPDSIATPAIAGKKVTTIIFISALLLTLAPNKWTYELGVLTNFAAMATMLFVVLLSRANRCARNFFLLYSLIIFTVGFGFSTTNEWPGLDNLGIVWNNIKPQILGMRIVVSCFNIAVACAIVALLCHYYRVFLASHPAHARPDGAMSSTSYRDAHPNSSPDLTAHPTARTTCCGGEHPRHKNLLTHHTSTTRYKNSINNFCRNNILALPLALLIAIIPLLDVASFAKAALSRKDTYSTVRGNFEAIFQHSCNLAHHILVEPNPNADVLSSAEGLSATAALSGYSKLNIGFSGNGIPLRVIDRPHSIGASHPYMAYSQQDPYPGSSQYPGMSGGLNLAQGYQGHQGNQGDPNPSISGSRVRLPFGLNSSQIPALGSFGYDSAAKLITGWYALPKYSSHRPLLAIAAIGAIQSWDRHHVSSYGQSVLLEFAVKNGMHITRNTIVVPIDTAKTHSWRDLRYPLNSVRWANVVRLRLSDTNLAPEQWIGITPPRVPQLVNLSTLIHHNTPVYKDLAIAARFPCITSVHFHQGLWQIPQWRITANSKEMNASTMTWSKPEDGGPLAMLEALTRQETLPSFLAGDLYEDWGAIIRVTPLELAPMARIEHRITTRWGWYRTGPIRAFGGNDAPQDS